MNVMLAAVFICVGLGLVSRRLSAVSYVVIGASATGMALIYLLLPWTR